MCFGSSPAPRTSQGRARSRSERLSGTRSDAADRIIVGEVRGAEALDMLQAMNTGHDGSLSTVHANTPRDALARIETMVLMAGYDLPVRAIRQQVSSAVELIVHIERLQDGSRRVTSVTEVRRMEADNDWVTLQELFAFKIDPRRNRAAQADRSSPSSWRSSRSMGWSSRQSCSSTAFRRLLPLRTAALSERLSRRFRRSRRAACGRGAACRCSAGTRSHGRSSLERSFILTLPKPAEVTAASVTLRENGAPVADLAVSPTIRSGGRGAAVALVIDASNSMRGEAIWAAVTAARAFAAQRTPDLAIGVITFNRGQTVRLRPTTDEAHREQETTPHG